MALARVYHNTYTFSSTSSFPCPGLGRSRGLVLYHDLSPPPPPTALLPLLPRLASLTARATHLCELRRTATPLRTVQLCRSLLFLFCYDSSMSLFFFVYVHPGYANAGRRRLLLADDDFCCRVLFQQGLTGATEAVPRARAAGRPQYGSHSIREVLPRQRFHSGLKKGADTRVQL